MFFPESASQPIQAQGVVAAIAISTFFRLKFAVRGMSPPEAGSVRNIVEVGPATGVPLLTVMLTSTSRLSIAYNGHALVTEADMLYPAGMNMSTTIVVNIDISGIYAFSSYDPTWRDGAGIEIVDTSGSTYLLTASNSLQASAGGFIRDITFSRKFAASLSLFSDCLWSLTLVLIPTNLALTEPPPALDCAGECAHLPSGVLSILRSQLLFYAAIPVNFQIAFEVKAVNLGTATSLFNVLDLCDDEGNSIVSIFTGDTVGLRLQYMGTDIAVMGPSLVSNFADDWTAITVTRSDGILYLESGGSASSERQHHQSDVSAIGDWIGCENCQVFASAAGSYSALGYIRGLAIKGIGASTLRRTAK
jgi:hypothetical protein